MVEFILKGGVVLLPIIILSIAALALILERIVFFYRLREQNTDLGGYIVGLLETGNLAKVFLDLEKSGSPEAQVLLAGLIARNSDQNTETINLRMEAQALRHAAALERNIAYLSSIANLSTLLGLLGTVIGMIISFFNLNPVSDIPLSSLPSKLNSTSSPFFNSLTTSNSIT